MNTSRKQKLWIHPYVQDHIAQPLLCSVRAMCLKSQCRKHGHTAFHLKGRQADKGWWVRRHWSPHISRMKHALDLDSGSLSDVATVEPGWMTENARSSSLAGSAAGLHSCSWPQTTYGTRAVIGHFVFILEFNVFCDILIVHSTRTRGSK